MLLALALWTLDQLVNLRAPSDPRLSPDGRRLAYVLGGVVRVHPSSDVGPGARPRWSPDSRRLAYLRGGEIVVDERRLGAPGPITAFEWLPKGDGFAAVAVDAGAPPDPEVANTGHRFARLWMLRDGHAPRVVSGRDRHVVSFSVSPDGARAVYAAQPTPRNRDSFNVDLYTVDLATGAESPLVIQPGRDAEPSHSPDGRWVAFHSQAGSLNYFEARHVALVAAGGGAPRYLTLDSAVDVFRGGNSFAWSPDGLTLTFAAGQGVADVLVRVELGTGRETIVARDVSGGAPTGAFLRTSPERPPEVFALEPGGERQWTRIHDGLASLPRPKSEVIRWKSTDGVAIEGVLWLPPNHAGGRLPLLTELHGGPTGVALRAFPMPRVYPTQMFLDRGIAVFAPNFRGSANYGAAFRLRNTLSQGVGDFADVMAGIDMLVARGTADPDRLGVMGWSYGGYLAASAITQTRRFKAASVGAPATDWITYYGQSDGPREVLWTYFGGSPWEVPDNYRRHSPRGGLGLIRTPTLLQVGAQDINHNAEIFQALTDNGVPVEYVVYPREGHGIAEPAHIRDLLERNLRWFTRWL
jgi:dipeptidyl aminopeptidase/acylaminoacyl peptidase